MKKLVNSGTISYNDSHFIYSITSISSLGVEKTLIFADLASPERVRKSVYLGKNLVECVEKNSALIAFCKSISYLEKDERDKFNFNQS